jgi:hypothetical protein
VRETPALASTVRPEPSCRSNLFYSRGTPNAAIDIKIEDQCQSLPARCSSTAA